MSQILYLASDCPLAEIKNPHYKMLSVNEALAIGMENIPNFMLEPEFDKNQPGVLLWSDTETAIDTETNTIDDGGLDDDFAILELDDTTEDIYTHKQHRVYIEWNYSRGRAEKVISYIRSHLEQTDEIELWQAWLGNGANTKIVKYAIQIEDLTSEVLERIDAAMVCEEAPTQYCVVISENAYRLNSAHMENLLQFLPLPLGEVPRRGGEGVFPLSHGQRPCQLSHRESQADSSR